MSIVDHLRYSHNASEMPDQPGCRTEVESSHVTRIQVLWYDLSSPNMTMVAESAVHSKAWKPKSSHGP